MRNGVLTISAKHGETIEVFTGDDGELEVLGNVVVEEEEPEEEIEEPIGFPDEPNMPIDSKSHLVDRDGHYPLIAGLQVGDKVRLRQDLDVDSDNIKAIGLFRYDDMLADLSGKDIKIRAIYFEYDEIDDSDFDCLEVEGSKCVWFLSTRWVTKVVVEEDSEEEMEEIIESPDEPTNTYRNGHYPLIEGLQVGDKVRLRLDLDEEEDNIKYIGLYGYYEYMLKDLADRDLIIEGIIKRYDEIADTHKDDLYIDGWHLSTRWVTKVGE